MECPNGKEIIEYAKKRGVVNARLEYEGIFGWSLLGDGYDEDQWPLVWLVATECNIARGCGSTGKQQVRPERFKHPNMDKNKEKNT